VVGMGQRASWTTAWQESTGVDRAVSATALQGQKKIYTSSVEFT